MAEQKAKRTLPPRYYLPLGMLVMMWLVQLIQTFLPFLQLGQFGILPRSLVGLRGVLFAPLLHGSWAHLLSNTLPFVVLSTMIFFFYRKVAGKAFVMIYLLTGLAVWLFSRPVFHIGASGVVYGLVAFVFWTGIFNRSLKNIALALLVLFYYGSMFVGLLPLQDGISWESHLLGALVGIFTAYWYKKAGRDEEPPRYSWEEEPEEESRHFLDADTFLKSRRERELERRSDEHRLW